MSLFDSLLLLIISLTLVGIAYVVRSQRIVGRKLSELIILTRRLDKEFGNQVGELQNSIQALSAKTFMDSSSSRSAMKYVLSFTSYPSRFSTLEQILPSIQGQILKPTEIHLNLAREHYQQLPIALRKKLQSAGIKVFQGEDLGPGKKLIPTLSRTKLPIITIDDDLILSNDLTLQLMFQHQLFPGQIIASRTHRINPDSAGAPKSFHHWRKEYFQDPGPDARLFATSGAGTLFPAGSLHKDATDSTLYRELAFHTDDLWWYFQARRIGTNVRRIPGRRALHFIVGTQADGLWSTGNKERNDENLTKLLARYGNPLDKSKLR